MHPVFEGFLLGIGLIIAIGSQNAYVIRQGAMGKHLLALALTCIICDALMIAVGSLGVGGLIAKTHWLRIILMSGGVLFLVGYGLRSLFHMIKGDQPFTPGEGQECSCGKVILTAIAFSLLNPSTVLDTCVLIGGIASQYELLYQRTGFAMGAISASIVWFFSLTYLSKLLKRTLQKPVAARIFDGTIAAIMFFLAGSLAWQEIRLWTIS